MSIVVENYYLVSPFLNIEQTFYSLAKRIAQTYSSNVSKCSRALKTSEKLIFMKKSILKIGSLLEKKEQKDILGGGHPLQQDPSGCIYLNEINCNNHPTCIWHGCYCGPNYPHIAPCGG